MPGVALAVSSTRARLEPVERTFLALARLLRARGEDVAVVGLGEGRDLERLGERCRGAGARWIAVRDDRSTRRWPEVPAAWLAERAAPVLAGFDVVYADDGANPLFHLVRSKRYAPGSPPVCVTVLHGGRLRVVERERERGDVAGDLHLDYLERYAARRSDLVVAPDADALEWAVREGWRFESAPERIGPLEDSAAAADRWASFHERARSATQRPARTLLAPTAIDVCVTYYDKHRYFPQLLESLAAQTRGGFGVIAVDDGSPDPAARACFEAMAERFADRGWTFFRQENAWVDAARNRAAARSRADHLLMLDADDVLARVAIERFADAAAVSGADALVARSCLFDGDAPPYDAESGEITATLFARYHPLGADLLGGLLEPVVFGGPALFVRREAFEAVGGYRELRGHAHEDWELHARLAFAGYDTDVLPEDLHFYRRLPDGLARTTDPLLAARRISDAYDARLAGVGLVGLARAAAVLHRRCRALERRVWALERRAGDDDGRVLAARLQTFAADDAGPPLVRMLRRAYRRHVSLETRLRLHDRLRRLGARAD